MVLSSLVSFALTGGRNEDGATDGRISLDRELSFCSNQNLKWLKDLDSQMVENPELFREEEKLETERSIRQQKKSISTLSLIYFFHFTSCT